ncbi:hypothetical protein CYMTET_39233 [Cymbomonas tetramitiformis]|uniref:Cyclic nucleotide-binding domain-containing protein n=1 Tax=Cymbomonas tetramitiformis TaxID=36881 RepID=A0AAE0F4G8_9CHLO|nr:hypothetical protein CYMTET_39233 [Cymbomonas tetramitiformis]
MPSEIVAMESVNGQADNSGDREPDLSSSQITVKEAKTPVEKLIHEVAEESPSRVNCRSVDSDEEMLRQSACPPRSPIRNSLLKGDSKVGLPVAKVSAKTADEYTQLSAYNGQDPSVANGDAHESHTSTQVQNWMRDAEAGPPPEVVTSARNQGITTYNKGTATYRQSTEKRKKRSKDTVARMQSGSSNPYLGILIKDSTERHKRPKKKVRFTLSDADNQHFLGSLFVYLSRYYPWLQNKASEVHKALLVYEMWAFPYRPALGVITRPNMTGSILLVDILVDSLRLLFLMSEWRCAYNEAYVYYHGVLGESASTEQLAALQAKFRKSSPFKQLTFVTRDVLKDRGRELTKELLAICSMYIAYLVDVSEWITYVLMLPRLIFPIKLWSYVRAQEMAIQVDVRKVAVMKFGILMFGATHWLGCGFYWLSRTQGFDSTSMVGQFKEASETGFDPDSSRQGPFQYLYVVFRGLGALSSMGYEQAIPKTAYEMICSVAMLFISLVMEAYVLGTLFHYLVKKDPDVEAFQKRMQNLNDYVAHRDLPSQLVERLNQYFEFQYSKQSAVSSNTVMAALPHSLQVKVCSYQYEDVIVRNRSLFRGSSDQFLSMLTLHLKEVYLMPGEVLIKQGDMSRSISFVRHGSLECSKNDIVLRTVRADSDDATVVGEVAFLMGIPEPYTFASREASDCTLLVFSKDDYEALILDFPEQHDILVTHLLAEYELDKVGNDMKVHGDEEDENFTELKQRIQVL